MKRVILINGPLYSGKDTVANALYKLDNTALRRFSQPIKDVVTAFFSLTTHDLLMLDKRENKDAPQTMLHGRSYRQAQIEIGEYLRSAYGFDIFARMLIRRVQDSASDTIIVPDCGFQHEVDGVAKAFGMHNVLLLRLSRPNTDYNNDSRGPVAHKYMIALHNNQTVHDIQDTALAVVEEWIART